MPFLNKSEQVIKMKNERDAVMRHCKMERMKTSRAISELVHYCHQHQEEDPLIYPLKENPFKDKRTCKIL